MKKIITILGTRPEITRLSPILPLLDKEFNQLVVHTGQHYDHELDGVFFKDLNLRLPDYNLHVGSGSHGYQTGEMLKRLEEVLLKEKPDLVIIFGDTNSTLAGALTATKLNIPILYLEAGCRNFNKEGQKTFNKIMPEEKNRIMASQVSDYQFVADEICIQNLLNEGIPKDRIYLTGTTGAEASLRNIQYAQKSDILKKLDLGKEDYALLTLHRTQNVDNIEVFKGIIYTLNEISNLIKIVFPVHPHTQKNIKENNMKLNKNIILTSPLGYLDFLKLFSNSKFILTDSGGIQEEAVALNIPCFILRTETEWIKYVKAGKNILVGVNPEDIISTVKKFIIDKKEYEKLKSLKVPLDTKVSEKIVNKIKEIIIKI